MNCAVHRWAWLLVLIAQTTGISAAALPAPKDFAAARRHWAYQPIRKPAVPPVHNPDLIRSPVDAFLLAHLETKGLSFAPLADRRTLLRRAYYDLIGLPPTFQEIEAFQSDGSPDAFARVVDRLLASPQYGERWGRHWLDVARYAETKDLVLLFGKDRLRPYAYTYRDYVIRSFNLDTPFDQFVQEQLAADQLELKGETWRLAALGFLTLGRLYDNNPHDQIDDQIDTTSRAFLGLTVSCARCHDHKYDAITTDDYYGLYGVFASSQRPYDLPLIEDPAKVPGGEAFEKKLEEARRKLEAHLDAEYAKLSETARQRVRDYLVRVATTPPDISETSSFFLSLAPDDLRPGLVSRWRNFLQERAREDDPIWGLWARLMALPHENFWDGAEPILTSALRSSQAVSFSSSPGRNAAPGIAHHEINPLVREAFEGALLTNKAEVARVYGQLLKRLYEHSKESAPNAKNERTEAERDLLAILTSKESPAYFPKSQTPQHMSRAEKDRYGALVLELDKLAAYATNPPPARAMVLVDAVERYQPHVFLRGNPAHPGPAVPRAFLRILSGSERKPFAHGSGRLDLARAITAAENPLTARVIVNRVWMHHLGEPLVNSPNDFGVRSEPPTHPELLDFLAATFKEEGWSLKKLHRLIMLSTVYQQSSTRRPLDAATRFETGDPDSKLLSRIPRQRLDLESFRDTLLFISGRLDAAIGGRSGDAAGDPLNRRRTIYGLVDRQDLPALFRAFDFAVPDQCVDRRPRTSVPQQALFVLNSSFAMEQAQALIARVQADADGPGKIAALYRLVLGRTPEPDEIQAALKFIRQAGSPSEAVADGRLTAWEQFAQVLLMSNELMFVD